MAAREKAKQEEEQKKNNEKKKIDKLKKLALNRMAKDKEQREIAKQQKEMLQDFTKRQDILSVLANYRRPLQHLFKFFARQDDIQLDESLSQKLNSINLPKLKKFCSMFRIIPEILSGDDMIYIFRQSTANKTFQMSAESSPSKSSLSKDNQCLDFDVNNLFLKFFVGILRTSCQNWLNAQR